MWSTTTDIADVALIIQTVIALSVIAVFVMAIVSFLLAIFDFITSRGEEEKKQRWRNRIRYMIIGIVLVVVFLIILPLFLRRVWVTTYQSFAAPAIFWRVGELMNYVFSFWGSLQEFSREGWFNLSPSQGAGSTTHYRL